MIQPAFEPAYHRLRKEDLVTRAESLHRQLTHCRICPRGCGVDRLAGETGFCGIGASVVVASYGPHFGEERPLVGRRGSGTVFFAGCNLGCVFCQNCEISRHREGRAVDCSQLADIFIEIEKMGCHNLNLVTPTHVVPHILLALIEARDRGLTLPLVWNSGGYDGIDMLTVLDGIVDIYMPDVKMLDPITAERLLNAADYPDVIRTALPEMHRQVGELAIEQGVAWRGLLVRHLVMPHDLAETARVARFIASISPSTAVNLMDQYHPSDRAFAIPDISRPLERPAFERARREAVAAGLTNLLP